MSDPEKTLARSRMELRRQTGGWADDSSAATGAGALEAKAFLAQASRAYDTAHLLPSNKMQTVKQLALRLVRFYTDRQVHFNRSLVQAVDGFSKMLFRLDRRCAALERDAEFRELEGATSAAPTARGLHRGRFARLYAEFQERFRGSPEAIRERLRVYVPYVTKCVADVSPAGPFLDVGCGRGELVAALRDAGVEAEGVEANPDLARACREAGVPVHRRDLFEELASREDASLIGVSAIQVVEHLDVEELLEFLELAHAKIAPNGILILETIDVSTLYALRWFFADPTHVLPLMPGTLRFYVESLGFASVDTVRLHPAAEPGEPVDPGDDRVDRLTDVVFGPQDFAVIAYRSPRDATSAAPRRAAGGRAPHA